MLPEDVLRILDAVPELRRGRARSSSTRRPKRLRGAKLLGKSASSPKLFKKHPELFALSPDKQPNKVQYIGPPLS